MSDFERALEAELLAAARRRTAARRRSLPTFFVAAVATAALTRVLDEDEYADIATRARTSESVIRKRVSRGLTGLRQRLEANRA